MMDMRLSRYEVVLRVGSMNELKAFGALIRKWREDQGFTAESVAPRVGLGTSTLSNVENGLRKSIPDPVLIHRLHRELGIPKKDMLEALGYLDPDMPEDDRPDIPDSVMRVLYEIKWDERAVKSATDALLWIREIQRGHI